MQLAPNMISVGIIAKNMSNRFLTTPTSVERALPCSLGRRTIADYRIDPWEIGVGCGRDLAKYQYFTFILQEGVDYTITVVPDAIQSAMNAGVALLLTTSCQNPWTDSAPDVTCVHSLAATGEFTLRLTIRGFLERDDVPYFDYPN